MSACDPMLADLVRLLSTMPQAERDFVLAGLSESECARLLPLLTPSDGNGLSPALSALVRSCEAGEPDRLAPRTAEALEAAVRRNKSDGPIVTKALQPRGTWWGRLIGHGASQ